MTPVLLERAVLASIALTVVFWLDLVAVEIVLEAVRFAVIWSLGSVLLVGTAGVLVALGRSRDERWRR